MRVLLTTRASSLRPLVIQGQRVLDMHQALSRLLAARTGDAAMASFLATPRALPRRDEIVWDSSAPGDVVRLSQAEGGARAAGEKRFADTFAAVTAVIEALRAFGDENRRRDAAALEAALSHPGDEDLFLVGDKPVLVNWGCAPAAVAASPSAPARTPRRSVAEAAVPAAEKPVHHVSRALPGPPAKPAPKKRRPLGPWPFAWAAVVLLAIAIPFGVRAMIPVPAQRFAAERDRYDGDVDRLRALAAQATRAREQCPIPPWAAFADRLSKASAPSDPLAVLAWDGASELAMRVFFPSGTAVKGGDNDDNRVAWFTATGALPSGHYTFQVRLISAGPLPEKPAAWAIKIVPTGEPPIERAGFIRPADADVWQPVVEFDVEGGK